MGFNKIHEDKNELAVVILFFEKANQTIECAESFLDSGKKIYILNNNSSSKSRELVVNFSKKHPQITIFDSNVNLGVGVGRNYLISHTKENWLFFVDNDIVIKTPDWYQRFEKYISSFPEIEVFIAKLYYVQQREFMKYSPFRIVGDNVIRDIPNKSFLWDELTNNFPGGASFVNRALFNRLGLYDEKMFVGAEDFEFAIRGIRTGEPIKAKHVNDIILYHIHKQSLVPEDRKQVEIRYNVDFVLSSINRITEKHNVILEGNWKRITQSYKKLLFEQRKKTNIKKELDFLSFLQQRVKKFENKVLDAFLKQLPSSIRDFSSFRLHQMPPAVPHSCLYFFISPNSIDAFSTKKKIKRNEFDDLENIKHVLTIYPSIQAFTLINNTADPLPDTIGKIVSFLRDSGKFVSIRIHLSAKENWDKITRNPDYIQIDYHDQNWKNEEFISLKERFERIGLCYELNRDNYLELNKLLAICDKIQPAFLHLTNYLTRNNTKTEFEKIITVQDLNLIQIINAACKGRDYIQMKPVYIDINQRKFSCRSYNYLITTNSVGDIGGCEFHVRPNEFFGNIFKNHNPFNSCAMWRLRGLMQEGNYPHRECRNCYANWQ